jgi:mannose-6-phosphate isomerase
MATSSVTREEYHVSPRGVVHFSFRFLVHYCIPIDRVYKKILQLSPREDHRPWGFYEILSDKPNHKVKRITVYPGQRLSYQRHFRRSEHWYVVSGRAVVTKGREGIELKPGQAIDVPVRTWHRIQNPGTENMVFIEVQSGDYFGEDDIERREDDYGRS